MMLGEKARDFKTHRDVSLDDLVPANNFYRKLESKLDLGFVRDLVQECYAVGMGRPSVDPVVFFKLQLIMFFEDLRSERQLMDQVHLNLAFRWYIGYDLDERVPDHSSLSKIRDRFGLTVFQCFFEQIVQRCIDAGLVWGKELHFDGTLAEANADYDQRVPRLYWQAHLEALFGDEEQTQAAAAPDRHLVHKYDGQQRVVKASNYSRQVDYWVNPVDPDATPMGKFKLSYRTHYVVDGGKARIILACLITPSTIQDNTPMVDLAWWARFRWRLPLEIAVADQKYGTIDNLLALEQGGVKAYVPLLGKGDNRHTNLFPRSMFVYDAQQDRYLCPQGESLHYTFTRKELRFYRTKANICKACPLRRQCTTSKRGRAISHTIHKPLLDRVAAYHDTEAYRKAMRKRQVWVEPKFAESKLWHHGRRFRLRRIHKVNMEGLIRASVQNIKQLLKTRPRCQPPDPLDAVANDPGSFFRLFCQSSLCR